MGFACAFGLFGALDDIADLGARLKLGLGALLGLAFTVTVAPIQALPLTDTLSLPLGPALGALGGALWIVTATNAVNFMDGANGVAPGGAAVALAALAAAAFAGGAPGVGAAALAGAAATAGFLPFNLKGRLFQGDAGALFGGFLFAALCLVACGRDGRGPVGLWFGPTALLPFLTDVLLTLLRRARGGRPLLQAHREHLYQRWLAASPGRTHAALALRTTAAMAASSALALALNAAPEPWRAAGFALATLGAILAWRAAGTRAP